MAIVVQTFDELPGPPGVNLYARVDAVFILTYAGIHRLENIFLDAC